MHRATVLLVPLLLLAVVPAQAADRKFDPEAAAKAVAPFLDDRTVAVAHIDLTRLDIDALAGRLAAIANLKVEDIAQQKKVVATMLESLTKAGARDVFVVVSLIDLPTEPPFFVIPVDKDAEAKAILELRPKQPGQLHSYGGPPNYEYEQIGKAVVGATEATRKRLKTLKPEARPEVAKAFAASGDGVARAVVFATTDARKILEETLPILPPELGGGSIKVLTRGLQWASVTVEAPPKMKVRWLYQASDKEAAKELRDLMGRAVKLLAEQKELRESVPDLGKLLEVFLPQVDGDRLTLTMDDTALVKVLAPAISKLRASAERAQSTNNLKQLGLAMHNYQNTYGRFPATAIVDKKDKPLLSWRVHLLPYLDEQKLYKEFKLDEPWDSEHNTKLIARMPRVFANPLNPKLAADGKTTYLAPVHKDAFFTGEKEGIRPVDVTDGFSQTAMLVDADDKAAVIWTKPDDLKLDPKEPAKNLSGRFGDQYLILYADGSVHFITKKVDKAALWALFTRGGEAVDIP